jgi:hypothetical protein
LIKKNNPNIFVLKLTLPGSNEKTFLPFYIKEYNEDQDSPLYYIYENDGSEIPTVVLLFDFVQPLRLQQVWIFTGPTSEPEEFDKDLKTLRNRSIFEFKK